MTKHWLLALIEQFADRTALLWNDIPVSYGQLHTQVESWIAELAESGGVSAKSIALIGEYSPNTTALLLALIASRAIAVPLTHSTAGPHRARWLSLAEVEKVIEFDREDAPHYSEWTTSRISPLLRDMRERHEPGLVLFSSGSTGDSKAILHSFDRILDKFLRPRPAMRTLAFMHLDHIGGINTLLGVLSAGGTAVSTSQRSPEAICQTIEKWQVELLPTSPTFLNMLLMSGVYKNYDLSSLQLITYGTEPMPPATLQRLVEAFPTVRFKQTYGMSELGILPSHSPSSSSLAIKLGGEGFQIKVKDGSLWIKSPSAMLGYLNQPSPFDADGWMDTGDLVEADGEWIRFLGRRSEVINVGGEKVFPAEVESVVLGVDNVRDVTVSGKKNPVTGNIVAARVVLQREEDIAQVKARIRQFCLARLARHKVPMLIEVVEELETQRTKKIRREA